MGLFSNMFKTEPAKSLKEKLNDFIKVDYITLLNNATFTEEGLSSNEDMQTKIMKYEVIINPPALNIFDCANFIVFGEDNINFTNFNTIFSAKHKKVNVDDIINLTNALNKLFKQNEPFTQSDADGITNDDYFSRLYFYNEQGVNMILNYDSENGLTLTKHGM